MSHSPSGSGSPSVDGCDPQIEDRIGGYSFVPGEIGKPIIEKLSLAVHTNRYRNVASPAGLRQKRSSVFRDNRLRVVLAAHWNRSIQSADENCKNFRLIYRVIF